MAGEEVQQVKPHGGDAPQLSVIVPAHNEEHFLPGCLASIAAARQRCEFTVETVVVLNRCTDGTERMARDAGAIIVTEDARSLSRIRNAGAHQARGKWLVTIDADSRMSPDLLEEVGNALRDETLVGGGVEIRPERTSPGIRFSFRFLELAQWLTGLSAGAFWCRRGDFVAVGGFDETLHYAEDVDFAGRLRRHGRMSGRRYRRLPRGHIVTSCRKFDRFGDWHAFTMMMGQPLKMYRALRGRETAIIDTYYYDFNDNEGDSPARRRKSR
jgi:glycosyltransferase involved in cell wall biosynthesis